MKLTGKQKKKLEEDKAEDDENHKSEMEKLIEKVNDMETYH